MIRLDGRTAIITGGAQGLGRAHAIRLAALGANVVLSDLTAGPGTGLQAVIDAVVAAGGKAVAHAGNVSEWSNAAALVALAVDTFGGLDILVNNAGITRDRTIIQMTEDEFGSVVDVHLKGHFATLHQAAAYWRAQTKAAAKVQASVINTTSGSGLRGNPGQVNYASAKAGIAAMTLVAAQELDRYGVRVNAIAPVARTQMTLQTPGWDKRFEIPEGAFDKWAPENISPLVAYLASAECHISGQVFSIVGGHIGWQQGWAEKESFVVQDRPWTEEELHTSLAKLPSNATFTPSA